MKRLFKRHYKAIVGRHLINSRTKDVEFYQKAKEELKEILHAPEDKKDQEIVDLMMVCANWLHHRGRNIKKEVRKNLKTQERRAYELNLKN